MSYSSYHSARGAHLLEIDRHKNVLQIELTRMQDGERIVGEFALVEAEEIAAALAGICRDIRKDQSCSQ